MILEARPSPAEDDKKSERLMTPELFILQSEAKADFGNAVEKLDIDLLRSRGLEEIKKTPEHMLGRINCMPTATMAVINILLGKRTFGFSDDELTQQDLYEVGVLSHINDKQGDDIEFKKGFPSFHHQSTEMYHGFAISLARRFGIDGFSLTNFSDTEFIKDLIKAGAVVIISLDNYFIRDVVVPELGLTDLSPGKHAEILHGIKNGKIVFSDVANSRGDQQWETLNLQTSPEELDKFLTCPRKNDFSSRAIVFLPPELSVTEAIKIIGDKSEINLVPEHPILSKMPELSLKDWSAKMSSLFKSKHLAQWDLVDHLS